MDQNVVQKKNFRLSHHMVYPVIKNCQNQQGKLFFTKFLVRRPTAKSRIVFVATQLPKNLLDDSRCFQFHQNMCLGICVAWMITRICILVSCPVSVDQIRWSEVDAFFEEITCGSQVHFSNTWNRQKSKAQREIQTPLVNKHSKFQPFCSLKYLNGSLQMVEFGAHFKLCEFCS